MITHILMVWTIVGFAGTQMSTHQRHDWRPLGEFYSDKGTNRCESAAKELGLDPKNYRCVRSK